MAPSLIHSVLRNRLSEPERAKEIFETILELLRHPSTSEDMVLALLHMLRSFLLAVRVHPQLLETKHGLIGQTIDTDSAYCLI